MSDAARKPDRSVIVILAVIAAVVVASLLVVFTRGEPPLRDSSTPEGVVQRFALAVIAGDDEAAAEYLSTDAIDNCDEYARENVRDSRVSLISTTEREDTADVRVSIITVYQGDPFGSESGYEDNFDLVKVDGDWLIEFAPWPFSICPPK